MAVTTNGVAVPRAATSFTVVSALIAVGEPDRDFGPAITRPIYRKTPSRSPSGRLTVFSTDEGDHDGTTGTRGDDFRAHLSHQQHHHHRRGHADARLRHRRRTRHRERPHPRGAH